jgi:hypothetical protein
MRPRIFNDLELKRHGLKIYLRNPSSYTPLLPEFQTPGGPTSLTLGMDHHKNMDEVRKFSARDAERVPMLLNFFFFGIDDGAEQASVCPRKLFYRSLIFEGKSRSLP